MVGVWHVIWQTRRRRRRKRKSRAQILHGNGVGKVHGLVALGGRRERTTPIGLRTFVVAVVGVGGVVVLLLVLLLLVLVVVLLLLVLMVLLWLLVAMIVTA